MDLHTQAAKTKQMNFDNAANTYNASSVLAREVNQRLLERLNFMRLEPHLILDLGAGTGEITTALEKKYRKPHILAMDLSSKMLMKAKQKSPWFSKQVFSCANAMTLPLPDQSVDLIYSNLLLYHCQAYTALFQELYRILKPGGLLLFSSLGPDTYCELTRAFTAANFSFKKPFFADMQDLGDALLRAKFSDPVMDAEKITLNYSKLHTLFTDLNNLGEAYLLVDNNFNLDNPEFISSISSHYAKNTETGAFPVSYEVIYGHAWAPKQALETQDTVKKETSIPISQITNISKEKKLKSFTNS